MLFMKGIPSFFDPWFCMLMNCGIFFRWGVQGGNGNVMLFYCNCKFYIMNFKNLKVIIKNAMGWFLDKCVL
jgi:hypothetical protein